MTEAKQTAPYSSSVISAGQTNKSTATPHHNHMEEEFEELDPLFSYTRVQPTNFGWPEDDSDTSPQNLPKRRKTNKAGNNEKIKVINPSQIIDCDDDEDDDEFWLPPPPKVTDTLSTLEEDSTIREIRLKKQELKLLAQSTREFLRASEEATKVAEQASLSEAEALKEEPWTFSKGKGNRDGYLEHTDRLKNSVQPTSVRAKIVISIQDPAENKQFRVFADEKFEGIFQKYAERAKHDVHKLVFTFDGDKIDPTSTPQSLGMEDDDIIEAHVKTR